MKKFTLIKSEVVPMLITETVEIEALNLRQLKRLIMNISLKKLQRRLNYEYIKSF